MALAALIVAIVAALIALASAAYTRRQAVATEAAAAIEGKRLDDDLAPQLAVTCTERPGTRRADMTVELTGPAGLDGLDEVTIRIRDDMPDRKPRPGSDLTQEQISEVIWGPYRLNPGVRDTDPTGRAHGPFGLPEHEPIRGADERLAGAGPVPADRSARCRLRRGDADAACLRRPGRRRRTG